jgi:hypothetical protein
VFWIALFALAFIALYSAILWSAATHDLQNKKTYSGWERIKRFWLMGGL